MEKFEGKLLKVKTEKSTIEGIMSAFDKENGKITIENDSKKLEMNFNEILDISLLQEEIPLKESDMYALFYEAFNIFGPFEDQFIYAVATSLKKFMRDISTCTIKIIIESDDIFGRIGLCFARLILGKVKCLTVDLRCELYDFNTLKYRGAFINSGGCFDASNTEERSFTLILFACNRNCNFERNGAISNQILLLDIPKTSNLPNFTGLGLGFIPENCNSCNRSYYVIDVGFGNALATKYKLPYNLKNSLVKMDLNSSKNQ